MKLLKRIPLTMHDLADDYMDSSGCPVLCVSGLQEFFSFPKGTKKIDLLIFDEPGKNLVELRRTLHGKWRACRENQALTVQLFLELSSILDQLAGNRKRAYVEIEY